MPIFFVTDKKEFPLLISNSDLLLLTVYSTGISGTPAMWQTPC